MATLKVIAQPCVGDCDRTGSVSTAELVVCVGLALGSAQTECADCAGNDGVVQVTDLVLAIANSMGSCPTPTPTDTATTTPTASTTGTHTSTPTATETDTPTPTSTNDATVTPTRTFTPTVTTTPRQARLFTVAEPTGPIGSSPDETRSGLFSSPFGGDTVLQTLLAETLVLSIGSPDANGVAELELAEDAVLALVNPIGVVCLRLRAEASSGEVDCDGGTAFGVALTQESGPDAPPAVLQTGLGLDSGTGAALLLVQQEAVQLPAFSTLEDCLEAEYDPAALTAYTTGVATATKGEQVLSLAGENFDCRNILQTDSAGMFVNPSVAFLTIPAGDAANVLRLADSAQPRSIACGNGALDIGETCDDGGFCIGDSINITCETNRNMCPNGRQCIDRICACRNDEDCESGHSCVEGNCMLRCADSSDCPSGLCRPLGGDGCAANCTDEDRRTTLLVTPLSPSRVQTNSTVIDLNLSAIQQFDTGQIRDDRPVDPQGDVITEPGEIPVVIKATGAVFAPVPVPGLVCACVRQIPAPELFGPNNSGVGKIGCGAQGLMNVDYKIIQDHNTNPGDGNNGTTSGQSIPQIANDPECDDEFEFPSGVVSPACRELSGDPLCNDATAHFHPGICISPRLITFGGGQAPRGSALIDNSIGIGLLADNGACRTDRPMQNGQCRFRDYGPDCLPCTPDDVDHGTQENLPATTGTAKGAVYDADNVVTPGFSFPVPIDEGSEIACTSNANCEPHEQCRRSCEGSGFPCTSNANCGAGDICRAGSQCEVQCGSIVRCLIAQTGTPFDCDALFANPTGGLSGAALAVTFPDIDSKRLRDNVTASILTLN